MENGVCYPVGSTAACSYAGTFLQQAGITLIDHPAPEVNLLLMDVPSLNDDAQLRGGGDLIQLLRTLPPEVTIIGGNLNHPKLEGYRKMDLLKDASYLAENALITAHCAVHIAAKHMQFIFAGCPVLVVGWGRIGKCLSFLLKNLGAVVTVAARKETDRAMAHALGFAVVDTQKLTAVPYRVVFNTVPWVLLQKEKHCGAVIIELASTPGILGDGIISARGLPGIYAPESSGQLIARTILRKLKEELQ